MNFLIQPDYEGTESNAIAHACIIDGVGSFRRGNELRDGEIPVGSVEFVENFCGIKKPFYYPDFLKGFFKREIREYNWRDGFYEDGYVPDVTGKFVKPLDRHKRFDGFICQNKKDIPKFPIAASEVVNFVSEWRIYVAKGEECAKFQYIGDDEIEIPELGIDWPILFGGAVDFGLNEKGEVLLVENNLPYACGWYGSIDEGRVYAEWLESGWNYVNNYYV
jgi:hypothetical protein